MDDLKFVETVIFEDGEELNEYESEKHVVWRNKKGQLHRKIGPVILYKKGEYYAWYLNGKKHRIGGPAIRHNVDLTEEWWQHGKLHRTDGPAKQYFGEKYFIRGKELSKKEFINNIALKRIKKINGNTRKNK